MYTKMEKGYGTPRCKIAQYRTLQQKTDLVITYFILNAGFSLGGRYVLTPCGNKVFNFVPNTNIRE